MAIAALLLSVQPFTTAQASESDTSPVTMHHASLELDPGRTTQQWRFRVMLGKRDIGFHDFRIERSGGFEQVSINARFDVKILFIKAYEYSHQNIELWKNDCLTGIQAVTDDNGQPSRVRGEITADSFRLETIEDSRELPAECPRSFAYWNPAFLSSTHLLNAQTGEVTEVTITRQPDEEILVKGGPVAAARYAVATEDGTISLWYCRETGQWLALEAPTPGGRVLRYQAEELPFELVRAGRA
jgi:hypothetical protein